MELSIDHSIRQEPDFVDHRHAELLALCLQYDLDFHEGRTIFWHDPRIPQHEEETVEVHGHLAENWRMPSPDSNSEVPKIRSPQAATAMHTFSHRLPLFCAFKEGCLTVYNHLARRVNRVMREAPTLPRFNARMEPISAQQLSGRGTNTSPHSLRVEQVEPRVTGELPASLASAKVQRHRRNSPNLTSHPMAREVTLTNPAAPCQAQALSARYIDTHCAKLTHCLPHNLVQAIGTTFTHPTGSAPAGTDQADATGHCMFLPLSGPGCSSQYPHPPHPVASVFLPYPIADLEAMIQHAQDSAYVFFDTVDHYRIRQLLPQWGLREIIEDAVRNTQAQPITAVKVLRVPLPGLPAVQIVLDSANLPPNWITTPVDLRAHNVPICTVGVPSDASAFEIALRVERFCRTPRQLSHWVARSHYSFFPPGILWADPFQPNILATHPTVISSIAAAGSDSGTTETLSQEESSSDASSSRTNQDFHVMEAQDFSEEPTFTVAFHPLGYPPWVHTFPRLTTPEEVAQLAAQSMAQATRQPGWRTQFLWQQPIAQGIDLHCMLTPIPHPTHGVFLADFRRIFGPDLRGMTALPIVPNTPQTADMMCAAAVRCLEEWALADPPHDFVVTTARKGALLVPAGDRPAAVTETLDVVQQLPGFRQVLLTLVPAPRVARNYTQEAIARANPLPTTSTTTGMQTDELPYFVQPLAPHPLTLIRLGISRVGVFTVEFQGTPTVGEMLGRAWAAALQTVPRVNEQALKLTPCQPQAWASHREILLIAYTTDSDQTGTVSVWLDLRPQGVLAFRQASRDIDPNLLLKELKGYKALFRNGVKWSDRVILNEGDYITGSLVPQAPDVRPNDFFIQRIQGLAGLLLPIHINSELQFETTTCFELDQEIAQQAWSHALQERLYDLGLHDAQNPPFLILGPHIEAQGAVSEVTPRLEDVASWVRKWVLPEASAMQLHDTEGYIQGRRLFVLTPCQMDSAEQYLRIHVTGEAVHAFMLPHSMRPGDLRRLAPISDAESRPVPGRSWYGTLFPATDLHRMQVVDQHTTPCTCRDDFTTADSHPVISVSRWRQMRHRLRVADATLESRENSQSDRLDRASAENTGHTTTTTTGVRTLPISRDVFRVPGSPILLAITGGAIAGTEMTEVTPDSLANALADLIGQHRLRQQGPREGCLVMAKSHPGRQSPYREIVMLWHPLDFNVHILTDLRGIGGGLGHCAVDSDVDLQQLVPTDLRRRPMLIYINGIPMPLFRSTLQDGDYVTYESQAPSIPAIPRSALFRSWPALGALGVDLLIEDFEHLLITPAAFARTLTTHLLTAIDTRLTTLGYHITPCQQAIVYSRSRGEIIVFVQGRLPARSGQKLKWCGCSRSGRRPIKSLIQGPFHGMHPSF